MNAHNSEFEEFRISVAIGLFGLSLVFLIIPLVISFMEIRISLHALDILLGDMERG